MKKIIKNKKMLLIFLTVVLFLILLSTYIKTSEIELTSIFEQNQNQNDKTKEKELLFGTGQKTKNEIMEQQPLQALTKNGDNQKTNSKETAAVERIALITEIKDPFKVEAEQKNSAENFAEKSLELEEQKVNLNKDLIFLEKNIIAENLIDQPNSGEKSFQSKIEIDKKSSSENIENNSNDKQSIESIRLPFKLLGIIKNKNNSAALFLYQGQTILKKEKEKIDIFKIEKINNKNLKISYQNEKRTLHLWKEKNNEK